MILFLQQEAQSSEPDKKESLEVAIQCIESAFDVDYQRDSSELPEHVNLLNLFASSLPAAKKEKPSTQSISEAEAFKNEGNDLMRQGMYKEAVDQYTRAIFINPDNAVYYCNRAAAFSRLELHEYVIEDCECAVKLDPNYGKAYGRLGIAYSNLNMTKKARDAYLKAIQLDPTNVMYQENLKLAEERLALNNSDSAPIDRNADLNQFMTNPTLLNMATQMLSDPGLRDVMSGILQMGEEGSGPNIDTLLTMGQRLAMQMEMNNPNFVDNLRRQFSVERSGEANNTDTVQSAESTGNSTLPKDESSTS